MNPSSPHHMIGQVILALALAISSQAAAATFAFTGMEMNDTPPPAPSALCDPGQVRVAFSPTTATVSGSSNFGTFAPTMAHCLTPPPTSYTGGVFDFTFEAGDQLTGIYSGFFTPTGVPSVLNNTVNYVVTGGTGRFLGATGTIQGLGILDRSVPRPLGTLALTGSLELPAVPEPATWSMMICGFGLTGSAIRRRRKAIAA